MFSGLIWIGQKSIELGLADGFGSLDSVARDVIKAEDIVDFTAEARTSPRSSRGASAPARRARCVESALRGSAVGIR